jgi:hypothetical protein
LELFDDALNEGHNRGFVFDHDHQLRHLNPQDLEFVAGQAFDDVAPLHGITPGWIGHPDPRYIIAVSGHTDWGIPGRKGDGLDPTVAHLLRSLPERSWRGFALLDVDGLSDDALSAFARNADPRGWVTIGADANERVRAMEPFRQMPVPYGSATLGDLPGAIRTWMKEDTDW